MLPIRNAGAAPLNKIPEVSVEAFRAEILNSVSTGGRLAALFPAQKLSEKKFRFLAVLALGRQGVLSVLSTLIDVKYPALTPECLQAHWFEREIAEQWGVTALGHPWLKPIRFHSTTGPMPAPGITPHFQVQGDEIHEVAVGPVHAGVIEPGHFRFQCHGEKVMHLEILLGYQHRGVERALVGGPNTRAIHYMETLAGDTSIGHALAYCQAVEALSDCRVSPRAEALRGIALELERLANHVGDLGALANDIGFLPTASYCGRLRGDFLNMTALICGSRFGRGLLRPGGVGFDLEEARVEYLLARLEKAMKDTAVAVNLLWDSPSVMARFEETGIVSREVCQELGLVGPAARACGLERDIRHEFPSGIFRFAQIPVSTWQTGDVFARAYVRWLEIQRSAVFVRDQLSSLPDGPIRSPLKKLAPDSLAVTLVEGWRGEICHVALTDAEGRFSSYKVVDPSFHNWQGLAIAMRGQAISDFPLCNKSFNLSYCGHDL